MMGRDCIIIGQDITITALKRLISEDPIALAGEINQFAYVDSVGKPLLGMNSAFENLASKRIIRCPIDA
jgi:hypothetical protein